MVFTLSATAPQFLPEQEKKERATLTEEELAQVVEDIQGMSNFEETAEMVTSGLEELQRALECMTDFEKRAYNEACNKVPDLVQKESDPLAFLRSERYNAKAAANRLVEYWKHRKTLFGMKAFEPMTLNGSLSCKDLETLRKGYMMILPHSNSGRTVLFFDGAPTESLERDSVLRVWFYLLHIATRDEEVQKNGYIIINSVKGFDVSKHFDRILGKKSFELVNKAMPAPLRTSHACLGHSMPAIQLVAPASKQMAGKHIRLRAVSHSGSNEEMLQSLADYGLSAKNLCHRLGGVYTHADFLKWLSDQLQKEENHAAHYHPSLQ